eukprot:695186-Hanusia_phi.AAC.1
MAASSSHRQHPLSSPCGLLRRESGLAQSHGYLRHPTRRDSRRPCGWPTDLSTATTRQTVRSSMAY